MAVEEAYDRLSRRIKKAYRNNPEEYAKLKAAVNSYDFRRMQKFLREKREEAIKGVEESKKKGLVAFFDYFEKILELSEMAGKAGKSRYREIERGWIFKKTVRIPIYTLTVEEEAKLVDLTTGVGKIIENNFSKFARGDIKTHFDGMLLCYQGVHKLRAYANAKKMSEESYRSHLYHYQATFGKHYWPFLKGISSSTHGILAGDFNSLIRHEIPKVIDAEFKEFLGSGGDSEVALVATLMGIGFAITSSLIALMTGVLPPQSSIVFLVIGLFAMAAMAAKGWYKGPVVTPHAVFYLS